MVSKHFELNIKISNVLAYNDSTLYILKMKFVYFKFLQNKLLYKVSWHLYFKINFQLLIDFL